MNFEEWGRSTGFFSDVATVLTFGVALLALLVAWRQIKAGTEVSREAGAMQAFRSYLDLCFREPQYSSTEMFLKANPSIDLAKIESALTPESERYLWFLTMLLSTCEEITTSVSAGGKWRRILVLHIGFHRPAFRVLWLDWRKFYREPVRALVDEAIA